MREIKFRAWDKENKKMFDVDELLNLWSQYSNDSPLRMTPHVRAIKQQPYGADMSLIVGEDCVLMQFTGLKDKKGAEIYEGDIVKFGNALGVVKWANGDCAEFFVRAKQWAFYEMQGKLFCWDELEVIGNIYENKELLKE